MADQMTDAELAAGLPPPEQRPAQRLGIPPALPTPSEGVPTGNTPPGLERLGGMLSMLDALRQKKTITDEEYRLFVKDAIAANIATPALAPRPAVTGQEGQGARFERFLMDEAEHRRKPWKTRRQNVLDRFYAGGETSTEEFRECFESLAERGKLSPYDILVCHYLLYVDDVEMGRMMLLGLLLTTDRSDIVETHNWNMHSLMTATQQEGRGKPIPSLKPLFPPWAQQRLNEEAFAAARGGLQGGDAGPTPAVRGKSYSDLYLLDDQIMEGGAYSEAVYDHNGQQVAAISMNETEARLECILRAIEELKASVQGRGQGTRRQTMSANAPVFAAPHAQGPAVQPQQQRTQQPQQRQRQAGWRGGESILDDQSQHRAAAAKKTKSARRCEKPPGGRKPVGEECPQRR